MNERLQSMRNPRGGRATRSQRLCLAMSLAALACWGIGAAGVRGDEPFAPVDRVILIDGSAIDAAVEKIDAQGQVQLAGQNALQPLAGLRRIEKAQVVHPQLVEPVEGGTAPLVLELVGGGRLVAQSAVLDDEACTIRWAHGDKLALPIDALRALRLQPQRTESDFEAALAGEPEENDRIFLRVEEKLDVVRGLIEKLDDKELAFEFQGERTVVPRERVFGVVLAAIGDDAPQPGVCTVRFAGGTSAWGESYGMLQLTGKIASLADGTLTVTVAGEAVPLPWNSVKSVTVHSDRLTFLSDLKPASAEMTPIVGPARSWQADRSVAGNTLTLRKQTFEKGLGVPSNSRLVFELAKEHDLLAATLGIDDETGGQGDCEFVVRGDGRELFRLRTTGRDEPHPLRLDIAGVKRLELIVEAGAELDLADHADWADACLIRGGEE